MFNAIPTETDALRHLLGELYDDLPGRLGRLRLLVAMDDDFGGSGVFLPGGEAAFLAYTEARSSFITGNFLACVLLVQAAIEQILSGSLVMAGRTLPQRATFKEILALCETAGLVRPIDKANIDRLKAIRNPLTHHRPIDDPASLSMRAYEQGVHVTVMCEDDARHAILTIIHLLSHPLFASGRKRVTAEARKAGTAGA